MPTAGAEGPWPTRGHLKTRLAEAFPTRSSPSAFTVGMPRKFAKNSAACVISRSWIVLKRQCAVRGRMPAERFFFLGISAHADGER